jgi:hypothetical protein
MIARKKNKPKDTQSTEAPAGNIVLDTVDVVTNKATGEKYAYYDNLTNEEKRLFSQDSPIGRFIRSKAMRGKGLDASEVADFATALPKAALNAIGQTTAIPQAAMVEALAYATGKPANLANALPNYDSFKSSQRTPSEVFMSPDANPIAKMAVDIVADPSNIAGGFGLLKGAKVMNSLSKAASSAAKKFDEVAFGIKNLDEVPESLRTIDAIDTAPAVKPKQITPDMPLTASSGQEKKVVHVLTDEGDVYDDVTSRADLYDSTIESEIKESLPKEITIDGNTFRLNKNADKNVAASQAGFVKQYNERIGSLSTSDDVITTEQAFSEISQNKDVIQPILKNIKDLEKAGVTEQRASEADRMLISFYQTSNGNRAVNTKKNDAYPGLAEYLKTKLNDIVMKQPKSTQNYKFFSGRKKFDDLVDIYDESGNVLQSNVPLAQAKPGDIISFNTILSGSLDKNKAFDFGNHVMEVLVPKGTSTMNVNVSRDIKADEFGGLFKEVENVLYKDAKFRILKSGTITSPNGIKSSGMKVELMNPKVLIPAFVTLKLNQSQDESEE